MSFTISNSNLADFSDAAVFVHPGPANAIDFDWTGANGGVATHAHRRDPRRPGRRAGVSCTCTTTPSRTPARASTSTPPPGHDTTGTSVYQAILQNNTFYNDAYGIQTQSPAAHRQPGQLALVGRSPGDERHLRRLDVDVAVATPGPERLQPAPVQPLLSATRTNIVSTTNDGDFAGNNGPSYGESRSSSARSGPASTRPPRTSSSSPTSPAIDAGRSEIGPLAGGNAIYPGTNCRLTGGQVVGTRTNPAHAPGQRGPGQVRPRSASSGGFVQHPRSSRRYDSRQIVTLPGSGYFSFPDQWQPVLTGTPDGYSGPSSNADTYNYQPYSGVRDILGYIRVPDPGVPGVGYGSNPFIDIGAYQYVNLHPPQVTAVTATETSTSSTTGTTTVPFYTVGGKAGSNTTPLTINVTFSEPIDPVDAHRQHRPARGARRRARARRQQFISLAGKLPYNSGTDTLVINLGSAGLTLPTDEYRLILFGSGSPVIANTQGIALDGENLSNGDDPNSGTQLALPSGNGYPGGNFYDTFIINTTPPSIVPGIARRCRRPATPTSSATTSRPRPRRPSPARSASPTRRWSRSPARRRSSTSASPSTSTARSRPSSTPASSPASLSQLRPVHPPQRRAPG